MHFIASDNIPKVDDPWPSCRGWTFITEILQAEKRFAIHPEISNVYRIRKIGWSNVPCQQIKENYAQYTFYHNANLSTTGKPINKILNYIWIDNALIQLLMVNKLDVG